MVDIEIDNALHPCIDQFTPLSNVSAEHLIHMWRISHKTKKTKNINRVEMCGNYIFPTAHAQALNLVKRSSVVRTESFRCVSDIRNHIVLCRCCHCCSNLILRCCCQNHWFFHSPTDTEHTSFFNPPPLSLSHTPGFRVLSFTPQWKPMVTRVGVKGGWNLTPQNPGVSDGRNENHHKRYVQCWTGEWVVVMTMSGDNRYLV